jgi:hypothetical protein
MISYKYHFLSMETWKGDRYVAKGCEPASIGPHFYPS